jgi:hypothetical protein
MPVPSQEYNQFSGISDDHQRRDQQQADGDQQHDL